MKISALIPYKPDNGHRDNIWSLNKRRYEQFLPQIELCIGVDNSEPFCRARAINEAAKSASGDLFLIVDTDVVYNLNLINLIQIFIHVHPWIIPFNQGIRLTREATERLISQNIPEIIQVGDTDIQEIVTCPGAFMNVMTRACFESVQGLDERFRGWGREDEAMVISLDTICGRHFRMNEIIYHLWHTPAKNSPEYLNNNDDLLFRYIAARGDVAAMYKLINERHN
ncbi:MAG: galactosyltransferase-related protein [Bacillota bacterium]